MKEKKATLISLAVILLLDVWYFMETVKIARGKSLIAVGPQYLPFLLSVILAALCIFKAVKIIMDKENGVVRFPNMKYVFITIGITILFLFSWSVFGLFYINCILYLWALITLYRSNLRWSVKTISTNFVISICMTLVIYGAFDLLMSVALTK